MPGPEMRRIDPDAEAARLSEERKLRTGIGHILCDEISLLDYAGEHGTLRVTVLSSLASPAIPVTLGRAIADLVTDQCYPPSEPGDG
jgi:hypothetical protein